MIFRAKISKFKFLRPFVPIWIFLILMANNVFEKGGLSLYDLLKEGDIQLWFNVMLGIVLPPLLLGPILFAATETAEQIEFTAEGISYKSLFGRTLKKIRWEEIGYFKRTFRSMILFSSKNTVTLTLSFLSKQDREHVLEWFSKNNIKLYNKSLMRDREKQ